MTMTTTTWQWWQWLDNNNDNNGLTTVMMKMMTTTTMATTTSTTTTMRTTWQQRLDDDDLTTMEIIWLDHCDSQWRTNSRDYKSSCHKILVEVLSAKSIEIVIVSVLTNIKNILDVCCIVCNSIGGKIDPSSSPGSKSSSNTPFVASGVMQSVGRVRPK